MVRVVMAVWSRSALCDRLALLAHIEWLYEIGCFVSPHTFGPILCGYGDVGRGIHASGIDDNSLSRLMGKREGVVG